MEYNNKQLCVKYIELTEIPMSIENQEERKAALCNTLSNYLRGSQYPLAIEMLCCSYSANQIHKALPKLYLGMWALLDPFSIRFANHHLQQQTETLINLLKDMGYTTRCSTGDEETLSVIPEELISTMRIWMCSNTLMESPRNYAPVTLLSAWNSCLLTMEQHPGAIVSMMVRCGNGILNFNLMTLATTSQIARHLYNSFSQGLPTAYRPQGQEMALGKAESYFMHRIEKQERVAPLDLTMVFALPVGSECNVLKVAMPAKRPMRFPEGVLDGTDYRIGCLSDATEHTITLPLHKRPQHMSVLGVSGYGKSNFLLTYLTEMWTDYGIPCLVIDPVTTEYRHLYGSMQGGHPLVFTPGKPHVSPFRFTLFAMDSFPHLTVAQYKHIVKDYLRATLNLFVPLDRFLDEVVDRTFLRKRWFDVYTPKEQRGMSITLDDLIHNFDVLFEEYQFEGQMRSMAQSGRIRLESLRENFMSVAAMPAHDVFRRPTVVELGDIRSVEKKSALLLFILMQVKLFLEERAALASQQPNGGVDALSKQTSLILVLDESHVFLESHGGNNDLNQSQQQVISAIYALLTEYRKYGLSVILADQRTSVLGEAMSNTHTQLVFKLTDPEGKKTSADIIGLEHPDLLAMQQPGQCYLKNSKMDEPVQLQTPLYVKHETTPLSDAHVHSHMLENFWNEHSALSRPHAVCRNCKLAVCDQKQASYCQQIVQLFDCETKPKIGQFENMEKFLIKSLKTIYERYRLQDTSQMRLCLNVNLMNLYKKLQNKKDESSTEKDKSSTK